MTDEAPIDLRDLDPGIPPDVVTGAIRRFRWRVVLTTVVAIVVATTATAWGVERYHDSRRRAEFQASILSPAQTAILTMGGINCDTPTYRIGGTDVTLLQLAPLEDGGWALHLIVRGSVPLTEERSFGDGSGSASRFTTLSVEGSTLPAGSVLTQPGVKIGETYLTAPASVGDRFTVQLTDTHASIVGSFMVDSAALSCSF
jgi:hypothetical protein